MRVIYKAPGGKPEIRDIPNTLEELQESVGGYIESCTFTTDATVICNEEGRLRGLPYNCRFLGVDFVGPILVVGIEGDEFTDLDPEAMGLLMRGLLFALRLTTMPTHQMGVKIRAHRQRRERVLTPRRKGKTQLF